MISKNLYTLSVGVVAAALLAACGSGSATAYDLAEETHASDHAETTVTDSKSAHDSEIKTRKASCRCGRLTVTYNGPDPERITLCHCNSCQLRTGTMFSVQGRFPRDKVTIDGESNTWTFPGDSPQPIEYPSCDSGGATYHFCPVCGTTVYWDIAAAPDLIGIAIGTLTDPSFPPPKISGFETYGHPWAMEASELPIKRLELAE